MAAAKSSSSVFRTFLALAATVLIAAACTPGAPSAAPSATSAVAATAPVTPPPAATPAAFPITIVDDEGTAVTIPAEPRRIVSLTPATTETLFAIGAGDRVVGKVEDVADFPPEAGGIPVVATFAGVDIEQIVALAPDLVVSGGAGLTQGDAVTQLRAAGIRVLVSYPTTIAAGLEGIRSIGLAIGRSDVAAGLVDDIRAELDALARVAATAAGRPRVFYEIDVTGGIFTPPVDSIYGELFSLANAEQIGGNASYQISLEELVAADPEVILLGDGAYGVTADAVAQRAGWGGMSAVLDGAIVAVDDIVITRPGPRIADGLRVLVAAIHPELTLP
jgi:iron complex transport system substrate-binding protein